MALHADQKTIFDDRFHLIFLVNNFQSWSSWTISMVMHEPCGERNRCLGGRTQETPEVIMYHNQGWGEYQIYEYEYKYEYL